MVPQCFTWFYLIWVHVGGMLPISIHNTVKWIIIDKFYDPYKMDTHHISPIKLLNMLTSHQKPTTSTVERKTVFYPKEWLYQVPWYSAQPNTLVKLIFIDIPNWKKPNKGNTGTVEWIFQVYQSPQVHSTVKSKKAFPACILVFIKVSGPSILQGLFQHGCIYIYIRRKFRSQTSDNMGRWKAGMGRVREEKRREEKLSLVSTTFLLVGLS